MDNLKQKDDNLLSSLDKLNLVHLIEEVRLDIFFLEKQCNIKKYFYEKASEERPFKICKKKYIAWENHVQDLLDNYEKSVNDYMEECNYLGELMDILSKYPENK